ncbi:hypothetical protein ACFLWZ_05245 [Chloroflexota bacterium]
MEKFVLAGKAKTVFQIIELMAKGEEFTKMQEADRKIMGLFIDNSYQLWPVSNQKWYLHRFPN